MNDAQHPVIRDPHAPANMVGSIDSIDSAVHDPLAALGPVSSPARNTDDADMFDHRLSDDLDRGLARLDPLTVRPRISSRVLCAVFGVLLILAAFGIWWLCVYTENGQSYDEIVWSQLPAHVPVWISGVIYAVAQSWLVIAVSCVLGGIGVIIALVRRRWWLVGQMAVFAAVCLAVTQIKQLLPRPFIIQTDSPVANSAPSGHTMLAAASAVLLLIAVPRAARALAAVVGGIWSVLVGVSVMVGQWHRTSDVLMSILLVAGLALITLAFTRTSGMDDPGRRVSSVSVQIAGSVLITGGLLLLAYSAYVIWQVLPGLNIEASWSVEGAIVSAVVSVSGIAALAFGLLLALRHITAAPLSRLGLIGAPPAPPAQPK
ncbi:phosphatase PAP2 family protein [Bifidobacterium imperatoris]|nr:phosphatase PAP2 family protein [Bifidobacterium imperatoris]QSY58789.1 phosphatase PAP2 family protein [Bifidobacterium imperatoris]